jgi:ElaA protein
MEIFGADTVYIEAQVYAQPFYENLGFVRISGEFLEDGIPHVKMLWKRAESGE